MPPIRRAILSVWDKTGLVEFGRGLCGLGIELISTGGTASTLRDAGLSVTDVASITGLADTLGGRVKTLHPAIFGAVLARRDEPGDIETLDDLGSALIDLVVTNLYPFEAAASRGAELAELIETIDIGGPSLIRAAAKNWRWVSVVVSPHRYSDVLTALQDHEGDVPEPLRRQLAVEAFERTAQYDSLIATTLGDRLSDKPSEGTADTRWPRRLSLHANLRRSLRYGENPHQAGAIYDLCPPGLAGVVDADPDSTPGALQADAVLGEERLSFNNMLDLEAAINLARDLRGAGHDTDAENAVATVIKHGQPCGAAVAPALSTAFQRAWDGDPMAAYGSVVALTQPLDLETAKLLSEPGRFVEALCAPGFEPAARAWLEEKASYRKRLRLLELPALAAPPDQPRKPALEARTLGSGLLLQQRDEETADADTWTKATSRAPSNQEAADLVLAEAACKHTRSNAIVLFREGALVGACGGSVSRVEAVRHAVAKAGDRARGAALASDAFFPFADGVEAALEAGVSAFVQPGGSKRDSEAVAAADQAGATMVLTGTRHFRH